MPKKTADEIYQKKTQHEHILARPEMYVGTIESVTDDMWVYDEAKEAMIQRKLTWIPGLYKIFDEILVNAADNKVRDPNQSLIDVKINPDTGEVRVWNNGEGIPVQIHKKHNLWIPEMIFGHLLTSSNYDDTEAKITGGRNGFGAKLTNVFSTKFVVETVHCRSKKRFKMRWGTNMLKPEEPQITPTSEGDEDFTCVTFRPDFSKFGMNGFDQDTVQLMTRRVYDIAGCTDRSLKVRLNGKTLKVRTFQEYVDLYPTMGEEKKAASYSRVNDRWEVCLRVSNIGFQQVSFVNSISTTRGGTHVKYITDQILDKVVAAVKKKHKDLDVKPFMIKPHLFIFINCLIDNPSFDSQSKETLNTTKPNFGSECSLPQSMIDYILKSGVVERTIETANSKLTKQMASKVKAAERGRITGIPKLDDANDAGTRYSQECTLILTEGDSAKALAVSGLSAVGRDRFGVFPLRGKPLNVRDASIKRVLDCEEIQAVMKIVGLKVGVNYESAMPLRYGHIMIMADQDHDGSHIKGLIVNFIHFFWPSLLRIPGFLVHFVTPIVKALPVRRGSIAAQSFFSLPDFFEWRRKTGAQQLKQFSIKYYKGLGTSTAAEGREYFENIRQHRIEFVRESERDEERIVMAFAKERVDDRKRWITAFNPEVSASVDFSIKRMSYSTFIDKELILFSIADCERSIPNVIDGLKPSQRKILYACFKRNLSKSIKVAQLAGYISEHAAYHHGEASLTSTIVGLAQNFVGANNVPLLVPEGQFGTRHGGGKDSASARYIFTVLSAITRAIYVKSDDFVLDYKDDDGFPVEPHFYVPVIPMVLVNGTTGIGTGFSTSIPNYNPLEIIANIRRLITGAEVVPMQPWYYGFSGTMEQRDKGKFVSKGCFTVHPNGVITVSELPIESWTNGYKKMLEEMHEKELILTFREHHTECTVDFDIVPHPEVLRQWTAAGVIEEKLQLTSFVHATNIIGFNEHEQLTKYLDAESVMKEFFLVRLNFYAKRKEYLSGELRRLVSKLENTVRFVSEVIEGKMVVNRRKKIEVLRQLKERGYAPFPPVAKKKYSKTTLESAEGEEQRGDEDPSDVLLNAGDTEHTTPEEQQATKDYEYLLGLKLWNFTFEMIERLQRQLEQRRTEANILESKDPRALWREDLDNLEAAVKSYFAGRDKETADTLRKRKHRREIDISRLKVPILSDKARAALAKDADKLEKKDAKVGKRPRKLKTDEGGDFNYETSSERSAQSGDLTLAQMASKPKNSRKVRRVETTAVANPAEGDDFDLNMFGLDAPHSLGPTSIPTAPSIVAGDGVKSKQTARPRAKAAKPRTKAGGKKATRKRRKKRHPDSDTTETSPSETDSETTPSVSVSSESGMSSVSKSTPPKSVTSVPPKKTVVKASVPPETAQVQKPADDDDDLFMLFGGSATKPLVPTVRAAKNSLPRVKTSSEGPKVKPVAKKSKSTQKKRHSDSDSDDDESDTESSSTLSSSAPSDMSDDTE